MYPILTFPPYPQPGFQLTFHLCKSSLLQLNFFNLGLIHGNLALEEQFRNNKCNLSNLTFDILQGNLGERDEAIIAFRKGNNSNIMKQLSSSSALYDTRENWIACRHLLSGTTMTVSATRYEVGQGHEHINGIVTVREIGWECVLEPMGVHMNTCYRVARSVAERGKA